MKKAVDYWYVSDYQLESACKELRTAFWGSPTDF